VRVRLYHMDVSHPSTAARMMLDRKGVAYETREIRPSLQPLVVRLAGFRGITVPALKADGRRIQGSLEIARWLEELQPEPPLFPADPRRRSAVEETERWCERELQPVPRHAFRWGLANDFELYRWFVRELSRLRPAGAVARLGWPGLRSFVRRTGVTDERVRAELAALPSMLDRVDSLMAEGVLGAGEPTAADYQVGTTIAALMGLEDLRPGIEGRPAAQLGERIWPDCPLEVRSVLPPEWLEPLLPAGARG
jgi:glutathione S-transferase